MIPTGAKVYVATRPVDFRKGPDGLAALVRDMIAILAALICVASSARTTFLVATFQRPRLRPCETAMDRPHQPFQVAAEAVGEMARRPTFRLEHVRIGHENAQCLGARGGHVEAVRAVEELHSPRGVGMTGGRD